MAFASLTIDLNARIANIERDMGRAAQVAERNSQRMQASFARAGQAFSGLIGAVGVGSFAAFIQSSIDAADELGKLSQKIGINIEQLAGYKVAADLSGISLEQFGTGVRQLRKNIAEQDPLLKKLGITATDADGAMLQLADLFQRLPNGAQKTAIAMTLMGKSGADMIPLLNGGGSALQGLIEKGREMNPITEEMARQAEKFNDTLTVFKTQASGAGISIANDLLPHMNAAFDAAEAATKEFGKFNGALVGLGQLGPIGQTVGVLWANVAYVFKGVGVEIGGIAAQLSALGRGEFKQAGIIGDMMKRDAVIARKEIDAIEKRIMGLAGKPVDAAKLAASTKRGNSLEANILGSDKTSGSAKSAKSAKDKLDLIDPFGKERRAAEEAALKISLDANNAAFDALDALRNEQIAQDERAAASLGRLRDAHIGILDPIQQYRDKLDEVQTLLDAGQFTSDQAAAASLYWQEQIDAAAGFGAEVKKQTTEMDLFWENAAKGFQTHLADYLFDPFKDGMDGMLQGFGNLLKRMAAEAIAADISRAIFGDSKNNTAGLLAGLGGSSDQNLLGSFASLFGFASGGSFKVGGSGGTDSQLVAFKASPDERVTIETPAQQRARGSQPIYMTVVTQDAASFSKSRGQIQADLAFAVQGARRYQ